MTPTPAATITALRLMCTATHPSSIVELVLYELRQGTVYADHSTDQLWLEVGRSEVPIEFGQHPRYWNAELQELIS